MTENGYITEIKRALLKEGFWGQPVQKLVEELRDHFRVKTEALAAEGHPLPEARKLVAAALGDPTTVAAEWSQTFQSKYWTARHPWLAGAIGFCAIWVFLVLSIWAFANLSGETDPSTTNLPSRFLVECWLFLVNWVPWIMGMGVLVWKTVRSPMGWRPLLVLSFALGLATSAWQFTCYFPPDGRSRWGITMDGSTWTSLWSYPLFYYLHMLREVGYQGEGVWARLWLCSNSFKLFFPPLACLAARRILLGCNWLRVYFQNQKV